MYGEHSTAQRLNGARRSRTPAIPWLAALLRPLALLVRSWRARCPGACAGWARRPRDKGVLLLDAAEHAGVLEARGWEALVGRLATSSRKRGDPSTR